jgi:conjugative element/phage-associated large polyvalent protein
MSLAGQFRGDIQADTLAQETALPAPEIKKQSLAEQFRSTPIADTVGRNLNVAQQTTPEQHLKYSRLADQAGMPIDAVERNYDEILAQTKRRDTDPVEIAQKNPSLAKWLSKPDNAALATNDIGILRKIDSALTTATDPLRQAESELIRLPGTILSGTGSLIKSATNLADTLTGGALTSIDDYLNEQLGKKGKPPLFVPSEALQQLGEPIKEFAADFAVPEERQNIVTDISGAVGQLGGQIAQAIAAPQTLVPSLLAQGADIQAERVKETGKEGAEADVAVVGGAIVTAALEKFGIGQLLNRIPPQMKSRFMKQAADIAVAGGIEAVQELVENIAQNVVTQQLVNPEQAIVDQSTWREITAAGGAASFLRAIIQAATRGRERQRGQQEQQQLDAIVEANGSTWLKENAPEKLQEFIAEAKSVGADAVYVSSEQAAVYFQTAGLDMNQVLTAAGVDRQDVLAAQATGGDIAIPLEIYTVALGEHHKAGLREFARITPEAVTPTEAADAESQRQETDAIVRQFVDSTKDEVAGAIKDDVVSKLVAIGQDQPTAEKYGTLLDKAFTTIAQRSGLDPMALYQKYGLTITQEGIKESPDDAVQVLQPKPSTVTLSQYSPDEVEFFRSMGIPVEDQASEPRPELRTTENVVTISGGTPRPSWAESTRVTGTDGQPATVYRGSRDGTTSAADFESTGAATGNPSAGLGVWLSADRGDAARYGQVGEYQLDLQNPKVYSIEDFPGFDSIEESRTLREQLQAQGHDGVVIDARNVGGPVQFVAFKPESIIQRPKKFNQQDVKANRGVFDVSADDAHYHRFTASGEVMARGGYAMFAENIDEVRSYGRHHYTFDPSDIDKAEIGYAGSEKFRSAFISAMKERADILDDYQTTAEALADELNPQKIVDSAGIWDAEDIAEVAINVANEFGWRAIETEDGVIVLDAAITRRSASLEDGDGETSFAGKPATLYQETGAERGQIRISQSGVNIRLFEKANLSTFLHESGHLFLEVLGGVANSPDAPQQVKDDYAAALKWLGVESRSQIGIEQHEQWARGFESYLGEGKSPSPELAGIFSRFRAWMLSIYKTLKNLNVELSDEVRGVFDRMLATDDEIASLANKAPAGEFQSQAESGMTDKQWGKYQELLVESRAELEGQLTARAYSEVKREKEAWWKERSKEVAAEVEAEANQMPVYQAWSFLSDGKQPDGSEYAGALEKQKLDKSALLSMYGQEFLNKGLRYKGVYQQEGGLHPSVVAAQFGYESSSQLVEALAGAPKKEVFVSRETRRRMLEQYGDIRNDGSLPELALKAAHNDRRFKALEVELEAIGRLIGRAPPKIANLRQLADNMISQKKPREIQPFLYLKAERKAARDFAELSGAGKKAQAYEAKQRQLLNGLLYDRAWKAQEEVEKIKDYATKLTKKPKQEKLAKAGGSYLQQINDILAAYEFRRLPLKQIDRRENLRQWVDKMQEDGDITAVPDEVIRRVEQNQSVNYQNVPLNELRGVHDSLRNIDHLSVLKNKLLKKGEQKDKDEAREEMLSRLRESYPNRKTLAASEFAKTKAEQLGDKLRGMADALWRPETIVEAMDGGESGPWHDYLWDPANQARATQNGLREKVGRPLAELSDRLTGEWQKTLADDWEIAGRKLTRRDIIGMALNLGNDGNRDKLTRGGYIENGQHRPYTPEEIAEAVSHLTAKDWGMVQEVWDTVESLWPEIIAQQQRLSGLPPEKVQATAFTIRSADGETVRMRGGYFPVAYDPRFTGQGEAQAEDAAKAMLAGKYTRAATPKGHLKERTDFAAPVMLDYQAVLTRHLDDVITDLSHREFLKQANWIVTDREIKNTLQERIGETGYSALRGFIGHTVGADRPLSDASTKAWHKVTDAVMANTAVYALGFRVITAWGNLVVAPIQAAARVKPQYMVRGFTEFYTNLAEATELIHSLSPFMKHRASDLDAGYVEVMNKLGGKNSVRRHIARASMQVHRWADYLGTHGIWLGRYRQAMDDGATAEDAAELADKAIRQTQTAGAPKDLSGVERDQTFKMFRMFIGPMLIMNNRIREAGTRRGVIDTWPEALGALMAAWFLPAVIFELAVGRGPDEDDEPEDWYKWMATKIGMYPLATIPVIRDIAATAEAKILGQYKQVRAAPIAEAGNAVVKAFATASEQIENAAEGEEVDAAKLTKDTLRALGPIFGLPTNQIDVTGSFMFDVMTKEYEPDSPLDYRYLLVRRPKEEQ